MNNNVMYFSPDDKFNVANIASGVDDAIAFIVFVDKDNKVDSISILNNTQYKYYFRDSFDVYVATISEAKGEGKLNYWLKFFEDMRKFKIDKNIFDKSFFIEATQKFGDKNVMCTTVFNIEHKYHR